MAILNGPASGLNVEITVNDIALEEHTDEAEENPPHTVNKYIEATSGVEFAVRATFRWGLPNAILLEVHLDGKWARGNFVRQNESRGSKYTLILDGSISEVNGQWFNQKCCFASLQTDDSDIRLADDAVKDVVKNIGEISVKCFHVKNLSIAANNSLTTRDTAGLSSVPEKALKGRALSHSASFRAPEATSHVSVYKYDFFDADKKAFATYNFRYRSREALRAMHILPRSPSSFRLEDRIIEDLNLEEMRELLRRLREQSHRAVEVKRERSDESERTIVEDDDEVSFVRAKRVKVPVTLNEDGVEILDLT
ncbi:hypothetical protein K491DRAFT_761121 [Lophiostoma macrostomum CBS 122681]|uniref:DUF7918 domain-containing protein n=1 Tax=Lophiostoma macrostomum CBS 122681 TaxID=1314788 RepID=A0A6A6SWA3_9PLEO|nr:hypothetical protein K491DRAFT_761121 [Lophiostoma macrostomum CBS 122681]